MGKVAIFIDGAYLQKVLENLFKSARINFELLSGLLADGMPILRTYYYNCMPYKSQTPTEEEKQRFARMQGFVDALAGLERFDVRMGKLECRGIDNNGKPIFQQKRVDVLLACDLVLLSAKQRIERAVVVTGDSDFMPAISIAKNEGVEVVLAYADGPCCTPHESLKKCVDSRRLISKDDINKIKLK